MILFVSDMNRYDSCASSERGIERSKVNCLSQAYIEALINTRNSCWPRKYFLTIRDDKKVLLNLKSRLRINCSFSFEFLTVFIVNIVRYCAEWPIVR